MAFGFTSNGTMITADEAQKLRKFPRVNASVSIDSFNPATFEQIRAGAQFERVWSNFQRLLATYDAPSRIYSVGMIVCKSNMAELASNIAFAIENNIGLNLSPVVIYPVTEQLNVFSDFSSETKGWYGAIAEAQKLVDSAKLRGDLAMTRVDPDGMLKEIKRLIDVARSDCSHTVSVSCEIFDPHDSIRKMQRPAIIAYVGSEACAYLQLVPGMRDVALRVPCRHLGTDKVVRLELVHDLMEPGSSLVGAWPRLDSEWLVVTFRISEFQEVKRSRNISWANYGDTTPDGHQISNPLEIHEIYRDLYALELKNESRSNIRVQARPIGMIRRLIRQVGRQSK